MSDDALTASGEVGVIARMAEFRVKLGRFRDGNRVLSQR